MSFNKFIFHGRLTKAPETRTTKKANGEDFKIAISDIAVNSNRKDESGNYVTDFFTIKAFDHTAELLLKCEKGSELIISGSIRNHNYTNKEGKKVYSFEFVADTLDYCGKKSDNKSNDTSVQNPVVDSSNTSEIEVSDDDLPF